MLFLTAFVLSLMSFGPWPRGDLHRSWYEMDFDEDAVDWELPRSPSGQQQSPSGQEDDFQDAEGGDEKPSALATEKKGYDYELADSPISDPDPDEGYGIPVMPFDELGLGLPDGRLTAFFQATVSARRRYVRTYVRTRWGVRGWVCTGGPRPISKQTEACQHTQASERCSENV